MNGDLSLSQSLGGLRIANPDEDPSSPSPPPQHHQLPLTQPTEDIQGTTSARFPLSQPSSTDTVTENPRQQIRPTSSPKLNQPQRR